MCHRWHTNSSCRFSWVWVWVYGCFGGGGGGGCARVCVCACVYVCQIFQCGTRFFSPCPSFPTCICPTCQHAQLPLTFRCPPAQLVLVTSECAKSGTFFFLGGNANTPNKDLTRTEKLVSGGGGDCVCVCVCVLRVCVCVCVACMCRVCVTLKTLIVLTPELCSVRSNPVSYHPSSSSCHLH